MKKLKNNIVAYLISIAICVSIAGAAFWTLDQIKGLIAETEESITACEEDKNDAHTVAELLRKMGYQDDSIFIQEMKRIWNEKNEEQMILQAQLDDLNAQAAQLEWSWDGPVLTRSKGVNYGPTGKETYYNLNMSGVVSMMRNRGYDAENYPYWVRNDGCKMLGPYIMVAANLNHFPRGSIVSTSLGLGLVCDTGHLGWSQLDIATNWHRRKVRTKKLINIMDYVA